MEAKDTILTEKQLKEKLGEDIIVGQQAKKALELQAGVSFKAGYVEGRDDREGAADEEYKGGRKAGVKEVVEWLETKIWSHYTDPSGTYHWIAMKAPGAIKLEEWQAKLKDWNKGVKGDNNTIS